MVHHHEHALYVELLMQLVQIVVGRVAVLHVEQSVGVADKLCGVFQVYYLDVVGTPYGEPVACRVGGNRDRTAGCQDEQPQQQVSQVGRSVSHLVQIYKIFLTLC